MYKKEEIIAELKRIAEQKGGNSLKQEDFEINSTIPMSTLRYHLGSWTRALGEAGLKAGKEGKGAKVIPKNDDELLKDLLRLCEDSGEIPSLALIEEKGKYGQKHYRDRWKSVSEAFLTARRKFPKKKTQPKVEPVQSVEPDPLEQTATGDVVKETIQIPEKNAVELQPESVQPDTLTKTDERKIFPDTGPPVEEKTSESIEPDVSTKTLERNIIGQPIPPVEDTHNRHKRQIMEPDMFEDIFKPAPPPDEPIDFQGLKYAPVDREGVIFLFGMVCHQLGYSIRSINKDFPVCQGKRGLGPERREWEQVTIQLEHKSSDFKTQGHDESRCDLIVCWKDDWPECPVEVLQLRSVIKMLSRDRD
ncbi:MAG: hypothetical protein GY940_06720 [bacterium]|nr:hypothetical protein [bacterium]